MRIRRDAPGASRSRKGELAGILCVTAERSRRMKREELEKLADRYQAKADRAFMSYHETGIARYDREHRNNEDLADALRMAARCADDAHRLADLRVTLADLGAEAKRLGSFKDYPEVDKFLKKVVESAVIRDLIRRE